METGRTVHKDLLVWQRAMTLAEIVYRVTKAFPLEERFGLVAQMRRAAVSVPSNIAEGAARRTSAEYLNFLHVARGSLAELETQRLLAVRLGMLRLEEDFALEIEKLGQLLNALVMAIRRRRKTVPPESRIPNPESR